MESCLGDFFSTASDNKIELKRQFQSVLDELGMVSGRVSQIRQEALKR